jgi:glycosyltransferase involved in cell wall biosynthesis
MEKFLTVIIRVYNREDTITRCINSVLEQTLIDEVQILVINDCSTDNTFNVVNDIKKNNPNVCIDIVNHHKNMDRGKALNTSKKYIIGKYCQVLDSDDKWNNNKHVENLKLFVGDNDYDFLCPENPYYHVFNIYSSELFKKCPICNINYGEDHYTWWIEDHCKNRGIYQNNYYSILSDSEDNKEGGKKYTCKYGNTRLQGLYECVMFKRKKMTEEEINDTIKLLRNEELNDVLMESFKEILEEYAFNKKWFIKNMFVDK